MNSRARFSLAALAVLLWPSSQRSIAASVSIAKARVRKSPRLQRAELLVLRAHVGGDAHLAGRGGEVVVPQQRQLLVDRLLDGHHAVDPPSRQRRRTRRRAGGCTACAPPGWPSCRARRRGLQLSASGWPGRRGRRRDLAARAGATRGRPIGPAPAAASTCGPFAPKPARRSTRAVAIHCDDCIRPLSAAQLWISYSLVMCLARQLWASSKTGITRSVFSWYSPKPGARSTMRS